MCPWYNFEKKYPAILFETKKTYFCTLNFYEKPYHKIYTR